MLQVCSPEFPTLTKAGFKTNISCENSEILGNLPGKTRERNHFMYVTFRKTTALKVSENSQKNVLVE